MSKKERFLSLLSSLMLKSRNEHAEFIESIPVNEERNSNKLYADIIEQGFSIRFPFYDDDPNLKSECKEKVASIGINIVLTALNELKDEITIDLKGHNRSSGKAKLKTGTHYLSIDRIARTLAFKVGVNTIIMPREIDESFSKQRSVSGLYDIFSFEPGQEDCIPLLGDRHSNCSYCGDEISPHLDINSFEIGLYPTPDLKSKSFSDNIEPRECKYPNGVNSYSNQIKTPSKKIVIANDLRQVLNDCPVDNHDYVSDKFGGYHTISTSQLANVYNTEFYVKHHNIMYIQTGSGVRALFQDKSSKKIEVKPEYLYDNTSDTETYNGRESETYLGGVEFTLWALCAMDYDQFVEFCKNKDDDKTVEDWIYELDAVVTDVKSSVTEFTSHYFAPERKDLMIAQLE